MPGWRRTPAQLEREERLERRAGAKPLRAISSSTCVRSCSTRRASGRASAPMAAASRRIVAAPRRRARERLLEHVLGALGEARALLDEPMRAARARDAGRAGDGEHLASLLEREPRRDERAAALAASTTTVPSESPLMMRLRRGKFGSGGVPHGNSETSAPCAAISAASPRASG